MREAMRRDRREAEGDSVARAVMQAAGYLGLTLLAVVVMYVYVPG